MPSKSPQRWQSTNAQTQQEQTTGWTTLDGINGCSPQQTKFTVGLCPARRVE